MRVDRSDIVPEHLKNKNSVCFIIFASFRFLLQRIGYIFPLFVYIHAFALLWYASEITLLGSYWEGLVCLSRCRVLLLITLSANL